MTGVALGGSRYKIESRTSCSMALIAIEGAMTSGEWKLGQSMHGELFRSVDEGPSTMTLCALRTECTLVDVYMAAGAVSGGAIEFK